jgi:hypothetical protein
MGHDPALYVQQYKLMLAKALQVLQAQLNAPELAMSAPTEECDSNLVALKCFPGFWRYIAPSFV